MIHLEFEKSTLLNLQHTLHNELHFGDYFGQDDYISWANYHDILSKITNRINQLSKKRSEALQNARATPDAKLRERWMKKFNCNYNTGMVKFTKAQLYDLMLLIQYCKERFEVENAGKAPDEQVMPMYLLDVNDKIGETLNNLAV